MSKPLRPEQVSAAMRFYAIAFAPVRKEPVGTDLERIPEQGESPPPINPQPKKDRP